MDNQNSNANPLQAMMNMMNGAKGMVEFLQKERNNPTITPDQKKIIDEHFQRHNIDAVPAQLDDVYQKILKHYGNGQSGTAK